MERQTKRIVEDVAIGAAYGTGTLVGLYSLFSVAPYTLREGSREEQRLDELTDQLNNVIIPGSSLTKNQISQVYSDVKNLNELNLRKKNEIQLNEIVSKLDTINSMTDLEGTLQQTQARTTLIGISDQLQCIRNSESTPTAVIGAFSITLGGTLILVCGYHAIKKGYNIIKKGCSAIFP